MRINRPVDAVITFTECVCVCVSVPVIFTLSLLLCSVFFYRKVNKCYRGRSCPIIVHCRQVSRQLQQSVLSLPGSLQASRSHAGLENVVCFDREVVSL